MAVTSKPVHASDVDDFAAFCHDFLVQSKDRWDGLPLELEAFQLEMMGEALAFGVGGAPVWESVVICMPRKNGKTELLAAYALFRLLTDTGLPEILLAASSDKQAGRLFEAACLYVWKNPALERLVRVREHVGELRLENGAGRIIRMSSDPRRLHGYNPTLVVLDELAQWTTPELKRAHAALTSGSAARSSPQVFTISTAGEAKDREDSILGRILDGALEYGDVEETPGRVVSRHHAAKTLVWNYEAPTDDPRDVEKMKLANPASWITLEYLAKQAAGHELTDSEVLQLHGGVWAAGDATWLPAGAWRSCEDPSIEVPGEAEVILAFDGSYNRDSTALVGCTLTDTPHIFCVGVWERPEGARDGWKVDREAVKRSVDEAMKRYTVRELTCDPHGWDAEVSEWGETYAGTQTLMFPANSRRTMTDACSAFYGAVLEKGLTHDGNHRLAVHLSNAVVQLGPNVKYITKENPNSPRKIDLAVAAVMAHYRAKAPRYTGPLFEVWA